MQRRVIWVKGHTKAVTSLGFAPYEQTLASRSADNMVRLWPISDGALLQMLMGHTNTVLSVVSFPDGETLASALVDDTVWPWRVK